MAYPIKTREQAFKLYCDGLSDEEIAAAVNIKRITTIEEWKAKYNWVNRRSRIVEKAERKTDEKKSTTLARDVDKITEKHARAADSLIGAIVFEINRLIEPMKRYVNARKAAEAAGENPDKLPLPPAADVGRMRKLTSSLKDAIFIERQAYGLSTESKDVNARIYKELFDFDRSKLPKKQRAVLDKLEGDVAAILEKGMVADDNIEDYQH